MRLSLFYVALLLVALSAVGCDETKRARERDPDAEALMELSVKAVARAQEIEPSAVLRQVDFVGSELSPIFRLTNASSTILVELTAERLDPAVGGFEVVTTETSKLLGHEAPGFSLRFLEVGPAAVVDRARERWVDCGPRGLSLVGKGDDLTWYVFCDTPYGVSSATVDGQTGLFAPTSRLPVLPPRTTTPRDR